MHNLIKYKDIYQKTSGSLWQYYTGEPLLTNAGVINDFPGNIAPFEFKQIVASKTENNSQKCCEKMLIKRLH